MENNETHKVRTEALAGGLFKAVCDTCGGVKVGMVSSSRRIAGEWGQNHVVKKHREEFPEKWVGIF